MRLLVRELVWVGEGKTQAAKAKGEERAKGGGKVVLLGLAWGRQMER